MNRLTVFLVVLTGLAVVATAVSLALALAPSLLSSLPSAAATLVGHGSFLAGAAMLVA